MDWRVSETARQRRRELLADAQRNHVWARVRPRRLSGRRRLGQWMLRVGSLCTRAGNALV
ncbi:MAG: hypothetical protein GIW99_07945 [Candidatus Eremiobacteraeota bacterium]|nr:hypothetical protein [Candidatus Eremiobacteraeota bacterium]MBC5827594.1 hypothetical protein [Candidatus Eremiobacteraeota bacterium]